MRLHLLILILVSRFASGTVSAQTPQFRLSQKSLLKIEQVTSAEKKLKLSKRLFHRDSIRFNRVMKRYYRHFSDSLADAVSNVKPFSKPSFMGGVESTMNPFADSLATLDTLELGTNAFTNMISHSSPLLPPSNISEESIFRKTSGVVEFDRVGKQYDQYMGSVSSENFSEQNLRVAGDQDFIDEAPSVKQMADFKNLSDTAFLKETAKKKAQDYAVKYIADNPQALRTIQAKMWRLMRKYSSVANSNDMSNAVKRSSLHGQRFRERIFVAANFQIPSIDPLTIDVSPSIGYRVNTRLISGVGINYRQAFSDSISNFAKTLWGYKAFTTFEITNQFLVYAEFACNTTPSLRNIELSHGRKWSAAVFAGIGRKFRVHRNIESTIAVLYDFLYERDNLTYPSPWSVRVGIQSSALGFR